VDGGGEGLVAGHVSVLPFPFPLPFPWLMLLTLLIPTIIGADPGADGDLSALQGDNIAAAAVAQNAKDEEADDVGDDDEGDGEHEKDDADPDPDPDGALDIALVERWKSERGDPAGRGRCWDAGDAARPRTPMLMPMPTPSLSFNPNPNGRLPLAGTVAGTATATSTSDERDLVR